MATIKPIEEKAKRYDEVLKKARMFYKDEHVDNEVNSLLEVLFPELKENEDENIRKTLIDFFSRGAENGAQTNGVCDKDIIAWLEKQGKYANFRNKIQIGDKVTRNEDGVLVNLSQLNRVAKKDEKQGEQKPPIEKLPEEMKTIGESLGFTTQEECDNYNQMVTDLIMSDETVEWSPQEENYISELELLVKEKWRKAEKEHNSASTEKMSELLFFLKTLNPNKKLQKQWKPSDEQMITLRLVISGCSYDIEPLVEMEEQLKKLREEDV